MDENIINCGFASKKEPINGIKRSTGNFQISQKINVFKLLRKNN